MWNKITYPFLNSNGETNSSNITLKTRVPHGISNHWQLDYFHVTGTVGGIHRVTSGFMMTSLNGNIFRVTGPLCGEFTGPGEFPAQRPVARSFDVFFDLRLNKWLSKQSGGWWFETLSRPLWRHCNGFHTKGQWFEKRFHVMSWRFLMQGVNQCPMRWGNTGIHQLQFVVIVIQC